MAAFGRAAFGGPVDDLRAAVSELGNGDIAGFRGCNRACKAQLRAKGVVVAGEAQGLPAFRYVITSTETVFESNVRVGFQ